MSTPRTSDAKLTVDLTSGLLDSRTVGVLGYEPAYAQALVKNVVFARSSSASCAGLSL